MERSRCRSNQPDPAPPAQNTDEDLRRRQQRRHLLSLYLVARDYAQQLEGAVRTGKSPTGFGAPLTPLPPDTADEVLAPMHDFMERLRNFVQQHAPEELAAHEQVQPAGNTAVWASNLVERMRQVAEELAPERLRGYGETALPLAELNELKRDLLEAVARARHGLRP
jgi:hypothetical protein